MTNQTGQSLIELLIAMGVFVVMVSAVAFLLIDSYTSNLQAAQNSRAIFLADEGLEAARSIRDNDWGALLPGEHGLAISNNHWIFQGESEDVSSQLREGRRVIKIEETELDWKKVTSQVSWQSELRPQEITLITYFTNWQKVIAPPPTGYCEGICAPCENFVGPKSCNAQSGCSWSGKLKVCTGTCQSCDAFSGQASCQAQSGCTWVAF